MFPDVTKNRLQWAWRWVLAQTRIPDLHWHDLRHEGTTLLLERGLSAIQVMTITGHSTKDMLDRYSHYNAVLVLKALEPTTTAARSDDDALRGNVLEAVRAARAAGMSGDEIRQLLSD